jgi:hypothetical protein
VPCRLQHVLLKRRARWSNVCVVWAMAASWACQLKRERGGGGC